MARHCIQRLLPDEPSSRIATTSMQVQCGTVAMSALATMTTPILGEEPPVDCVLHLAPHSQGV
jgi:hypothetical protein